jgi:uncharacterized membrane protein YhfC
VVNRALLFTFLAAGIMEIAIPIALGVAIWKRLNVGWRAYAVGCCMFTLSMIRLPLNQFSSMMIAMSTSGTMAWLLLRAFPSFTAGLFEEVSRFAAFRLLVKDLRWAEGVMYGAGHGGIESILLIGLTVLTTAITLAFSPASLPPEQLQMIATLPWHFPLIGLYERLMAIVIQIGLSVMVLQCYIQKKNMYLMLAITIHFAIDFAVLALVQYGVFWAELVATLFAAVMYLYLMRERHLEVSRDSSASEP